MKKLFTLFAVTGLITVPSFAQEEEEMEMKVEKKQCSFFMKTPPVRELMKMFPAPQESYENWVPKDRDPEEFMSWDLIDDKGIPDNGGMDPALQTVEPWKDGKGSMKASWQGLSGAFPPDPTGAAGLDQYVQAVNSTYRVYDKEGNNLHPAPLALHSLWPGSTSDGDPIVMYDRYADRWFISQFQTGTNKILIAISETSDALGSFYLYEWQFSSFPDYPKYAVWSNAYFMTANTNSYDCVAYERDKMLAGDPTASMITMFFPNVPLFFNSIGVAYAEGLWAPEADEPGWAFAVQEDSWSGVSDDHIKVFKITLDWNTPTNSDCVIHQSITTQSMNNVFTQWWDDITQQGTSQKLDAVAGIFMYKVQYRRFPGYDVVMLCHTVDVNNANRAGVKWYELRKDDGSDQWYIHQESTFDPNDGNSRWMGNIAMDLNGNVGLAYSIAGPNEYAGLRYTGRFANDPLNTMTVIEQEAVAGTGAQTLGNRYGDYSQMTVDPVDDATFWFTGEYLGPSGSRKSQIFSFAMWELVGQDELTNDPYFNAYQPNPTQLTVTWRDLADEQIDITIHDMNGKIIVQEAAVDATSEIRTFNVPAGATGVYVVSITGQNTQMSDKVYLSK